MEERQRQRQKAWGPGQQAHLKHSNTSLHRFSSRISSRGDDADSDDGAADAAANDPTPLSSAPCFSHDAVDAAADSSSMTRPGAREEPEKSAPTSFCVTGVCCAHATRWRNSSYDLAVTIARFFASSTAIRSLSRETEVASSREMARRSTPRESNASMELFMSKACLSKLWNSKDARAVQGATFRS